MIDFRSDVLARPSRDVLDAMLAAAAEPPGFKRREDRQQDALERELSEAFGFADGLFLPTGTMANQVALRVWCAPGETLLADHESHVAVNEAAATAGLNGVALHLVAGERGHPAPAAVETALAQRAKTDERRLRLVWLENTHNRAGGTVMPAGWLAEIADRASVRDVPVHVDGARILDAAIAANAALNDIAAGASSLMVSLNKGIGAPVGAVLLGSRAFIEEAVRVQGMFGGLWRPVGLLAAAARTAFAACRLRIEASHARARDFAARLEQRLAGRATVPVPETNIVMLELASEADVARLLAALRAGDILASAYRRARIRFVLHAGISTADLSLAVERIVCALDHPPVHET